jgi:hypothetical protein
MKRKFLILAVLALVAAAPAAARLQDAAPFYSVDTERRIEGTIKDVVFEPRYGDRASFLILLLEEKGARTLYRVEISPAWFFDRDLHKGEKVKVIGSYYTTKDGTNVLIARQLQAGGETFMLRDSRGFPSWRGGAAKAKGWRRRGQGM